MGKIKWLTHKDVQNRLKINSLTLAEHIFKDELLAYCKNLNEWNPLSSVQAWYHPDPALLPSYYAERAGLKKIKKNLTGLVFDEKDITPLQSGSLGKTVVGPGDTAAKGHESENYFRKEGNIWRVRHQKREFLFKDMKGLNYIRYLLYHPNKSIGVIPLFHQDRMQGDVRPEYQYDQDNLTIEGIDNSQIQKARVGVWRAIERAITEIRKHDSDLADHLKIFIDRGTSCMYHPSPHEQKNWK